MTRNPNCLSQMGPEVFGDLLDLRQGKTKSAHADGACSDTHVWFQAALKLLMLVADQRNLVPCMVNDVSDGLNCRLAFLKFWPILAAGCVTRSRLLALLGSNPCCHSLCCEWLATRLVVIPIGRMFYYYDRSR
jgi:hypothetical protein